MKGIHYVGIILVCGLLLLSACSNEEAAIKISPLPDIKAHLSKVYTDLTENAGWYVVTPDKRTFTIFAEAEQTETVLVWIVPTGTETWGERELVGYDIDGSDGWSFTWEFGDRTFHDRIYVQALGSDGMTQDTEVIKVTSET
ncbi:hypothetical protein [Marinicrinis lubricantis]|uniref:Uncharacterized protein n=1 Tax=Marinicrinis lubricantis TaxID=2086470 RepID=A0ABW1ITR5_9BACL